ncbi:hypothetical protein GCK72_003233 [Caenorhabditis remanei]|uniref:Uncharacterized protein n=1 Tax=Caenorhabditis remanei TaxID=31234 RepID=A0A6A5HXV2_CAERE|nr:hypothetical protein GCK72_003233 [Caenorhabditis remanei]KAF1771407.1 hypothetical protein GCK72_003233 [Caenorhabditis remanei]
MKLLCTILIFLIILPDSLQRCQDLRRGKREKCRGRNLCIDWCAKHNCSHLIPVCYQHRCWCVTEIAPLYIPLPFDPRRTTTTTTTEEPIIEEGSGQAEFFEETPKKTNILDYFSIFLPNAGDIDF